MTSAPCGARPYDGSMDAQTQRLADATILHSLQTSLAHTEQAERLRLDRPWEPVPCMVAAVWLGVTLACLL